MSVAITNYILHGAYGGHFHNTKKEDTLRQE